MDTPDRYDVFISYSRRDLAFARQLRDYLQRAGKVCWLDAHEIGHGQEWWPAILGAIERSACVVCLVSPAFRRSRFCHAEAGHARALKKKLIQVLWHEVGAIPDALAHVNAIPHGPDTTVDETAALVLAAIDHDFQYERQRRELLAKAAGWHEAGRRSSLLLRGSDLREARALLGRCTADGLATPLQADYVRAATAFQRRSLACRSGAAAAVLALGAALVLTGKLAYSYERAASAAVLAANDPMAALARGVEALRAADTVQAASALRSALAASPPLRVFKSAEYGGSTAMLPDGRMAIVGTDGSLYLCSPIAGTCGAAAGRLGPQARLIGDRGGAWLLAASGKQVWRIDGRGPRMMYSEQESRIVDLVASAGGDVAAIVRPDGAALLLDSAGGPARALGAAGMRPLALAPDGRRIAVHHHGAAGATVEVWQLEPGAGVRTRLSPPLPADVRGPALFSPDGSTLALALANEAAVLWHYGTGDAPLHLPHERSRDDTPWSILALAFSPDGRRLASAGEDGSARTWTVAHGEPELVLRGHAGAVRSLAFSPDGMRLATAGGDQSARLWSMRDGRLLGSFSGPAASLAQVGFSPDGMLLAAAGPGAVSVFPAGFGYPFVALRHHRDSVRSVAFSPDGARLLSASADGTVRNWELATGSSAPVGQEKREQWMPVGAARFSPDGRRILTFGDGCKVDIWSTGALRPEAAIELPQCGRISASFVDASTLWIGSRHGIRSWQRGGAGWHPAAPVHAAPVDGFALSPDGRWLASYRGAVLTLADREAAGAVWSIKAAAGVSGLAFSRDSAQIAVGTAGPLIETWELASRRQAGTLAGHRGAVHQLAFSPDGSLLATSSADGSVIVWDWAGRKQLAELAELAGTGERAYSVAFDPQGRYIAVGGSDNVVRLYGCPACGPAERLLQVGTRRLAAWGADGPAGERSALR